MTGHVEDPKCASTEPRIGRRVDRALRMWQVHPKSGKKVLSREVHRRDVVGTVGGNAWPGPCAECAVRETRFPTKGEQCRNRASHGTNRESSGGAVEERTGQVSAPQRMRGVVRGASILRKRGQTMNECDIHEGGVTETRKECVGARRPAPLGRDNGTATVPHAERSRKRAARTRKEGAGGSHSEGGKKMWQRGIHGTRPCMELGRKVVARHFAERGWVYVAGPCTKRRGGEMGEVEGCKRREIHRTIREMEMVVESVPG